MMRKVEIFLSIVKKAGSTHSNSPKTKKIFITKLYSTRENIEGKIYTEKELMGA